MFCFQNVKFELLLRNPSTLIKQARGCGSGIQGNEVNTRNTNTSHQYKNDFKYMVPDEINQGENEELKRVRHN